MPGRSHVVKYCALIGANDATLASCSDLFSSEVMAAVGVLERREKRTFMDDTIPLSVTITTYKLLPSHVVSSCSHISHKVIVTTTSSLSTSCTSIILYKLQEYIVRVQRGPNPDDSWEVGPPSTLVSRSPTLERSTRGGRGLVTSFTAVCCTALFSARPITAQYSVMC